MNNFLVELLVEEIPANLQQEALKAFADLIISGLKSERIFYSNVHACISPRRVVFSADLCPVVEEFCEEKKGPQVIASVQIIDKFLKANGISRADCVEKEIEKKRFIFARIVHPERKTIDLLPDIIKNAIVNIPWKKSMHWGTHLFHFVRPLRGIMAIFDNQKINVEIKRIDLHSVDYTVGHRFMDPRRIEPTNFDDYVSKLRNAFVIVDHVERERIILDEISKIEKRYGIKVDVPSKLLTEIVGLVEYPVVLVGKIPDKFMVLPEEVITTPMTDHQRYFHTKVDYKLSPYFVFVANNVTVDNGALIIKGNERVLNARLEDALFFFNVDLQKPLESSSDKLKKIVFHEKLGTLYERVLRIDKVCDFVCSDLNATDTETVLIKRANALAKCDLTTNMVCEFTELQGIMGGHYASMQGENPVVCEIVRYQYAAADDIPNRICALYYIADRIELITGFFSIGKVPTGTKDPFALRRAAIGILKLINRFSLDINLRKLICNTLTLFGINNTDVVDEIINFIYDRLKVALKESGIGHNIVVSLLKSNRRVLQIFNDAAQLHTFFITEQGKRLEQCYKRAFNIIEGNCDIDVDSSLFEEQVECDLYSSLQKLVSNDKADISDYLHNLLPLVGIIDDFFEKVLINCTDEQKHKNRINLITRFAMTSPIL